MTNIVTIHYNDVTLFQVFLYCHISLRGDTRFLLLKLMCKVFIIHVQRHSEIYSLAITYERYFLKMHLRLFYEFSNLKDFFPFTSCVYKLYRLCIGLYKKSLVRFRLLTEITEREFLTVVQCFLVEQNFSLIRRICKKQCIIYRDSQKNANKFLNLVGNHQN